LRIGELGDGSALGTGLSLALYHLDKSKAPKKSIVLITDGENNAGNIHPLTAARLCRENNISLYVLGIGTRGIVLVEYVDPISGHVISGQYDSNYDSVSLALIASEAGGKYFEVDSMRLLQQTLSAVERNESVIQSYHIKNEDTRLSYNFIFIAIIFFVIAWVIRRFILREVI
jgi:Ca-activated chloride channel family protein